MVNLKMTLISYLKEKIVAKISPMAILCIVLLPMMILFSEPLKYGVISGMELCFRNILPTLFPFFILSDLWAATMRPNDKGLTGKLFEKAFGISSAALPAFLLGSICGFPLGAKLGSRLYKENLISKSELERLSGFANNPSMAFVISGIGVGLYQDIRLGILLYISIVFAAISVGTMFSRGSNITNNTAVISRQSFNLVNSIKSAGIASLTLSVYIIFFSSVISLASAFIKDQLTLSILAGFIEISNAARLSASLSVEYRFIGLVTVAFALGFSGFSVHFQTFAILPKEVSRKKYMLMKMLQGILCSLFAFIFLLIIR